MSSFVNQWFIMVIYTITGDVKAAAPLNPTSANCFPFLCPCGGEACEPLEAPSSQEEMVVNSQSLVSCRPLTLFYFKVVKAMPNPKEHHSSPA